MVPPAAYKLAFYSFLLSLFLAPIVIYYFKRMNMGQRIRSVGPKRHLEKAGTPTMGGIIFLSVLAVFSLFLRPMSDRLLLALFLTFGHGLIGFADDFLKFYRRRSLGLKARSKLLAQFIFFLLFTAALLLRGHSTEVAVPFLSLHIDLGPLYYLLVLIIIVGFSNAVNLTDGIDGLAAGTTILALVANLFICLWRGIPELAYFCAILIGGTFGFLVFNLHPARIFMGDVGSLSLGAALAALAILTKTELYLVVIGGIYVLEAFSVTIQVLFYQLTGKRVFRMSPIHHHFELGGWSEWQVVMGFWAVAFVLALVALVNLGAFQPKI